MFLRGLTNDKIGEEDATPEGSHEEPHEDEHEVVNAEVRRDGADGEEDGGPEQHGAPPELVRQFREYEGAQHEAKHVAGLGRGHQPTIFAYQVPLGGKGDVWDWGGGIV